MYRTIKIRLHATKEQKEHLLAYEEVYHTDLQDLIHQLHKHPSSIRYADLCFSDAIEVHSRWLLYQTALKMFNRQLAHKNILWEIEYMGTAFFSNKKQSFNAALWKTIFTQKGHSAYEAAISGTAVPAGAYDYPYGSSP